MTYDLVIMTMVLKHVINEASSILILASIVVCRSHPGPRASRFSREIVWAFVGMYI